MKRINKIVETQFGLIKNIQQISGNVYHIFGKDFDLKLDVFHKSPEILNPWWVPGAKPVSPQYKMYRSLPVHKRAIELRLYVPKIYTILSERNKICKLSKWINGELLENFKSPEVFQNFGFYIASLNQHMITPCDPHFKNFVWTNKGVMCIDMKKFLFAEEEVHNLQMAKIILKSCKSCRTKAINVLKGYSKQRNPVDVIKIIDTLSWKMGKHSIERISLEEINER